MPPDSRGILAGFFNPKAFANLFVEQRAAAFLLGFVYVAGAPVIRR